MRAKDRRNPFIRPRDGTDGAQDEGPRRRRRRPRARDHSGPRAEQCLPVRGDGESEPGDPEGGEGGPDPRRHGRPHDRRLGEGARSRARGDRARGPARCWDRGRARCGGDSRGGPGPGVGPARDGQGVHAGPDAGSQDSWARQVLGVRRTARVPEVVGRCRLRVRDETPGPHGREGSPGVGRSHEVEGGRGRVREGDPGEGDRRPHEVPRRGEGRRGGVLPPGLLRRHPRRADADRAGPPPSVPDREGPGRGPRDDPRDRRCDGEAGNSVQGDPVRRVHGDPGRCPAPGVQCAIRGSGGDERAPDS